MTIVRFRTYGAGSSIVRFLAAMAMVAGLVSFAAPAQALPAPQAATCTGVWVVVDYGALGGTATGCATSYSTGMTALRATYTPTLDAGMVVKINSLPQVVDVQQSYWSYWHATRQADGSWSGWTYSSVGPSSYHPSTTVAEGWRYEPVNGGYVPPRIAPPAQAAAPPPPPTTAPAPTVRATVTTRAATTASAPTTSPAVAAAVPSSDSATPSPTPTPSETPTSIATTIDSSGGTPPSGHPTSMSASLVGSLAAIAAIGLGALGMLFWRKRAVRT